MKTLILSIALAAIAAAQTGPSQFVALGAGFNNTDYKQAIGYAAYGKRLTAVADTESRSGTVFSYSAASFVAGKPTTVETGVAIQAATVGPIAVLGLGTGGAAIGGDNLGSVFSGGAIAAIRLGKSQGYALVGAKAQRTTITDGVRPQFVFGVLWGF